MTLKHSATPVPLKPLLGSELPIPTYSVFYVPRKGYHRMLISRSINTVAWTGPTVPYRTNNLYGVEVRLRTCERIYRYPEERSAAESDVRIPSLI